jgi:outer membrane protein assembly factor BamA
MSGQTINLIIRPLLVGFLLLIGPKSSAGFCSEPADSALQTNKIEFLPILSYDTDAGFGYGVKLFFLSQFHHDESIDVVLFNSSNGERWYKIVFSIPDLEFREGTAYPLALDLTVDYDKWISYNFFGVGNSSSYNQRESYTREPLLISLVLSRGFSEQFVGQIGTKYAVIRNFNFDLNSTLARLSPDLNAGSVRFLSLQANCRYDSRNSFLNPSRGLVLQTEMEYAPRWRVNNVDFRRYGFSVQWYTPIVFATTVFAARAGVQSLDGDDLPVQLLLPVGGGTTIRGNPQDRFIDKLSAVVNAELRFPLYHRLGGVIGYDAGKVWENAGQIDLPRWSVSPAAGLRYYFDTFIIRLDAGFGRETTGFYLNFGQLF